MTTFRGKSRDGWGVFDQSGFRLEESPYVCSISCHLAALEDDDAHDVPTQRRRVALGIVVLLVLAAATLAWFAGLLT